MRAIMILYDSLNKNYISPFNNEVQRTPNLQRLEKLTVTFDNFYVGSMPCIPARRELHTGRYNFLHRCWGPVEPFDDSMPLLLSNNKIATHLATNHPHYWQEGGSTYHTKFSTCDMIRGKEGDFWAGQARGYEKKLDLRRQDIVNSTRLKEEKDYPHVCTFEAGIQFLEDNVDEDNWFLQLEYFDPHEPYDVPKRFRTKELTHNWPYYEEVTDKNKALVQEYRTGYEDHLAFEDHYLGKVLDFLEDNNMLEDTLLMVGTDHGFLLGEHDWFGKNAMPFYNEIVNTPFFLWDPRTKRKNERCNLLAQTIDIAPTILSYFGMEIPQYMQGKSLFDCLEKDIAPHEYVLFGLFGKHVNITDGRYVYMRSGRTDELNYYTIMPLHMFKSFSVEELAATDPKLSFDFKFTKGVPVMKIPANSELAPQGPCYQYEKHRKFKDLLFDLELDPLQLNPIDNPEIEKKLITEMIRLMRENEAPEEQFRRLGLC